MGFPKEIYDRAAAVLAGKGLANVVGDGASGTGRRFTACCRRSSRSTASCGRWG